MALALRPRIPYRQPEGLCRTLVYRWGGLLLGSRVKESEIIGGLVTAKDKRDRSERYDSAKKSQVHPTQTKAYRSEGGFSDVNTVTWNRKDYHYVGFTVIRRLDFALNERDANWDDHAGLVRQSLAEGVQLSSTPRQLAFALSLHYRYPSNNRESGHTVGIFISRGGFEARKPGARFLDPNIGSWRFGDFESLLQFYSNDWLPNFVAGAMRADPGHARGKRRNLTFFRLIGLLPV